MNKNKKILVKNSINKLVKKPINKSINKSVKKTTNKPINKLVKKKVNKPINKLVKKKVNKPINKLVKKTNLQKKTIIKEIINNNIIKILFISCNFHFLDDIINLIQNNKKYKIQKYLIKKIDKEQQNILSEYVKNYDIIFSEWFLDYSLFLSKIVDIKKQKLFIRLHRFEILKKFFLDANWKNIKKVIFVNPYIENIVKSKVNESINKTCVIYNCIKYPQISKEIFNNEEIKFNICLIGYVPKLKRPDIAIDIFRILKNIDFRYNLFFIGKNLDFIKTKPDEIEYYNKYFNNQTDFTVLPYNNDLSNFYNRMGHILICSDVESFHVSSHEALNYGIYPYYIGGCTDYLSNILPNEFLYKDINTLVNKIIENNNNFSREKNKIMYATYLERYNISNITNNILSLITQ